MKKTLLIAALGVASLQGKAQDKYVVSALTDAKENHLDEAKANIDKAMASPETKEKPKALFAKAYIYTALEQSDKYKASQPYREAAQAAFKLVQVKPDYEKESVDQILIGIGFLSYNDGAKAYNDKKYTESIELMNNVLKVYDMKRFSQFPPQMLKAFDTAAADAASTIANSTYYLGKYDEAVPLLIKVKNNPIRRSATVYELLIDAYNKQKKDAEALAVIQEGRKEYPEDVTLRNYELNYYIMQGKQDDLVKKLEDAAKNEPNNADIQFNIATTYLGMAAGKDGKKPANAAELSAKSEDAFKKAIQLSPENSVYNYNYGALFYNQATEVNSDMNAITGNSAADLKKYNELKDKRDGLFAKSQPYFEKAASILGANEANLKGDDMKTYKQTLLALKEVYGRQNKMDKLEEVKKKYDAVSKK